MLIEALGKLQPLNSLHPAIADCYELLQQETVSLAELLAHEESLERLIELTQEHGPISKMEQRCRNIAPTPAARPVAGF